MPAAPALPNTQPRSLPRATNHALILPLGGASGPDAASATAIARVMGVPDANIQQPTADALATAVTWGSAAVTLPGSRVPTPSDLVGIHAEVTHSPDPSAALAAARMHLG